MWKWNKTWLETCEEIKDHQSWYLTPRDFIKRNCKKSKFSICSRFCQNDDLVDRCTLKTQTGIAIGGNIVFGQILTDWIIVWKGNGLLIMTWRKSWQLVIGKSTMALHVELQVHARGDKIYHGTCVASIQGKDRTVPSYFKNQHFHKKTQRVRELTTCRRACSTSR